MKAAWNILKLSGVGGGGGVGDLREIVKMAPAYRSFKLFLPCKELEQE